MTNNEPYTPTTDEVRDRYSLVETGGDPYGPVVKKRAVKYLNAFDRWLAVHDREVAAKALRDAADELPLTDGGPLWRGWLLNTADIVEEETQ